MLFDNRGKVDVVLTFIEYIIILSFYYAVFALFVHGKISFIINKVTIFLGNISFALYLIYQYVSVKILIPFFESMGLNSFIVLILALLIVIVLAYIVTEFIESPLRKKMKSILINKL